MKHTIDAKNNIVGRVAVRVAFLLRGKDRPDFLPYKEGEDEVLVINSGEMKLSGRKASQKLYWRYSGYPGGIKKLTYKRAMEKNPAFVLWRAVYNMLPKNKLRGKWMKKLTIT